MECISYEKGSGKNFRKSMSLVEVVRFFSDEEATEQFFIQTRWPNGIACPFCGSLNVNERPNRRPQPFRCGDCFGDFSVKTNKLIHASKLSFGKWGLAMYQLAANLKGVSSLKLSRDLKATQTTAWHLTHWIRKALESEQGLFGGPVEVDETYVEGKWRGMGRGPKGGMSSGAGDKSRNPIGCLATARRWYCLPSRVTHQTAQENHWARRWTPGCR